MKTTHDLGPVNQSSMLGAPLVRPPSPRPEGLEDLRLASRLAPRLGWRPTPIRKRAHMATRLLTAFAALMVSADLRAEHRIEARARLLTSWTSTFGHDASRHAFDLDDLELGIRFSWSGFLAAEMQLDAARSSSPESLFGLQGNSLVAIVRRAYGELSFGAGPGRLTLRLGLVNDPIISTIETSIDLRVIANSLADTGSFIARSDLGLTTTWSSVSDDLSIGLGVFNGEGARDVERDDAKDLVVFARADILKFDLLDDQARLRVMVSGRVGTRGVGSVEQDRLSALLALVHPRVHLGLEGHIAFGYGARSDVDAHGLAATVRLSPLDWLAVGGRVDWLDLHAELAESEVLNADLGILLFPARILAEAVPDLADLAETARLWLGWRHVSTGARASPVPGLAESGRSNALVLSLELMAR